MKKELLAVIAALSFPALGAEAQELRTTRWEAYGVSFKAPADFSVEDDSEEGYTISNSAYYITVQLLEGEGFQRSELAGELKNIATDDEVTGQSAVEEFELPQFYGAKLTGNCETDRCMYSYLLTKDGGSGFYVSILYPEADSRIPEKILDSFRLDE